MKFLTYSELRDFLDISKFSIESLIKGFKAANTEHVWVNLDHLEQDMLKFAQEKGWDSEKMLVMYDSHKPEEKEIDNLEWDDIQIGYNDPKHQFVSAHQNMTVERLVSILIAALHSEESDDTNE